MKIHKLNETYIQLETDDLEVYNQISEQFQFLSKTAQYDKRYKAGKWDGQIRLFNKRNKTLYVGLLIELIDFLDSIGINYTIDETLLETNNQNIDQIIQELNVTNALGESIELYDYQIEAVKHMYLMNRSVCLAATSAGKSLIIYCLVRLYQDILDKDKIVISVPTKMLVEQLYSDFAEYSLNSDWNVEDHCQKMNSDYSKDIVNQVIITTWQTLCKQEDLIQDSRAIIVDEVHKASSAELKGILEKAINCQYRHGLTGTLNDIKSDDTIIKGLFGEIERFISAKELIKSGKATDVKVNVLILDYDDKTKLELQKQFKKIPKDGPAAAKYQCEIDYINNLQSRFNFIQFLVQDLKGNTVVLFDRKDSYGIPLYEDMKLQHENTFLISGDISSAERERIKTILENTDDAIVYATSSIMSTGVSIKNLHNVVLASSSKSKTKILQTIGRLMRLHETKDVANLYDLVDRLDHKNKSNLTLKHIQTRLKYYSEEGYKINIEEIDL